jgi:hypothetical protein
MIDRVGRQISLFDTEMTKRHRANWQSAFETHEKSTHGRGKAKTEGGHGIVKSRGRMGMNN